MTGTEVNYKEVPEGHWLLTASTDDIKVVLRRYECETKNKSREQLQKRVLRLSKQGLKLIDNPNIIKASKIHLAKVAAAKAEKAAKRSKKEGRVSNINNQNTDGKEGVGNTVGTENIEQNALVPANEDAYIDDFSDATSYISSDQGVIVENLLNLTGQGKTPEEINEDQSLEEFNKQVEENLKDKLVHIYENLSNSKSEESSDSEESDFEDLRRRFEIIKGEHKVDPKKESAIREKDSKEVKFGDVAKMGNETGVEESKTVLHRRQDIDLLARTVTFSNGDKEDILEFLEAYNAEADIYGWDDRERINRLKTSLKSDALSSWLCSHKYKKNEGWEDVQDELRLLFRKDEEEMERELNAMEYKEGQNFHRYVNKFERLMKQLKSKVTDLEIVSDLKQTLPQRMREYMATQNVKDKTGLIKAYTSWITFKKDAYDLDKYKQVMARLAATEKELQKYKSEDKKSGIGTNKEEEVDKLIAAFYRGTLRERGGVAGTSHPRQPYGGNLGRRGTAGQKVGDTGPTPPNGSKNCCYNCNRPGHYARDCWKRPGYRPGYNQGGNRVGSKPGPSYNSGKTFGPYHNKGSSQSQPKNAKTSS